MAGLLSLPNKIILDIYVLTRALSTHSLVQLSAANCHLRAIWLQDSNRIIAQSIQVKAPEHQDAIALTLLEARYPMPTTGFHTLHESWADPPLCLYLPQLMQNVKLASVMCHEMPGWDEDCGDGIPLAYPLATTYCLMRQLVVAYHYPQLRLPLCAILETLYTYERMGFWLTFEAPADLKRAHQLRAPFADRIRSGDATRDPWQLENG